MEILKVCGDIYYVPLVQSVSMLLKKANNKVEFKPIESPLSLSIDHTEQSFESDLKSGGATFSTSSESSVSSLGEEQNSISVSQLETQERLNTSPTSSVENNILRSSKASAAEAESRGFRLFSRKENPQPETSFHFKTPNIKLFLSKFSKNNKGTLVTLAPKPRK
jgi:hypothetical protein